jgi:hypothetical protein
MVDPGVKIEFKVSEVEGFPLTAATYRRIRPLISRKEAICITQKASKILEIATLTQFQEEMAQVSRVKLATVMVASLHRMVKMHRSSKLKSQRESSIINH